MALPLIQVTNMYYVNEMINRHISVFTCDGQFVTSFGADVAKLNPHGLAVDNSDVVYVCDFSMNKSIQILD